MNDSGRSDPLDMVQVNQLTRGLQVLADTQHRVGHSTPETDMVEGTPDGMRAVFLGLLSEVTELAWHFDWKPWKKPAEFKTEEAAEEFADVLAFLGYVVLYMGYRGVMTDDLARAYAKKTLLNQQRLAGKIDGYGA